MMASSNFKALVAENKNNQFSCTLTELEPSSLEVGQVRIQSAYSGINYKDALAVTSGSPILRKFPLIPGVDVSGTILESKDSRFKEGDSVVITGTDFGEIDMGGFSEEVVTSGNRVIPLPTNLTLKEAMILGTAGFTAALCVHRLEQNGQTPEMGPLLVTGASGGVGSIAVNIFSQRGYEVWALSGKPELKSLLQNLGAHKVVTQEELELGSRPLEKMKFGGAIDNVGGSLLSQVFSSINLWGSVACVGLAGGAQLETTVMPLILRGVSLIGVSSNNTPMPLRKKIWQDLSGELKPKALSLIHRETIGLEKVLAKAPEMLQRKSFGRTIIEF